MAGGERARGKTFSRIEISLPQSKRQCVESTTVSQSTSALAVLDACVKYFPVDGIPSKNDLKRALAELARLVKKNEALNIHENKRDV
jgi:hypothetical protein